MLMNMESSLRTARKHRFAVGAFSACDSLLSSTIMECAEGQHVPITIGPAPPRFPYVGSDSFVYAVKWMQSSSVPCVLHLDHGKTIQGYIRTTRCDFTSVMIDGSLLAYEDSVKPTRATIELTYGVDASVEGGIGTIGALPDSIEGGVEQVTHTKPKGVTDFLTRTNTDAPAMAVGAAHGIYPKEFASRLHLDTLKVIEKVNTCLPVLYGSSADRGEEIAEARRHGIYKANIASDVHKASLQDTEGMLIETDAF